MKIRVVSSKDEIDSLNTSCTVKIPIIGTKRYINTVIK